MDSNLDHPVGGGTNRLRYHPDTYFCGNNIESCSLIGYSGFGTVNSTKEVVAVIPLNTANGTKTITKINVFTRNSTSNGAGNVNLYAVGGDPESAIATGAAVDEDLAFVFANNAWNEITLDGGDYAPATGSMLALRFTHTGGTSFQLGANLGQVIAGARVMWAATVADPIQDTVWEQTDSICPAIQIQYSDSSREGTVMSLGGTSAGNTPIHGAISTGGCAGIGIQPDEDIAFNCIEAYLSTSGTTTSAGIVKCYIYDENKNLLWASSNSYDTSTSTLSSSERRIKDFYFEDNILQRGSKYYIVIGQTASGGSASHHVLLAGAVTSLYVTNAVPPRTFAENAWHGIWSVSSTTGVANLANNTTTAHNIRILRKPLTRTSQVF